MLITITIVTIATFVTMIAAIYNLNTKLNTLEANMPLGNSSGVIYDDDEETPSVFTEYNLEYGKKDTISQKDFTIDLKISATPIEFKEGAKAVAKINGKSYDLQQKDNRFTGKIRFSIFEEIKSAEIVLKDGETVRTGDILGDSGPYLPVGNDWMVWEDASSERRTDKVSLNQKFAYNDLNDPDDSKKSIKTIDIVGVSNEKTLFKQTSKGESARDMDVYPLKRDIKLAPGQTMDIFILEKGPYGITCKYKIETVKPYKKGDEMMIMQMESADQEVIVLNEKGKEIWKKKIQED